MADIIVRMLLNSDNYDKNLRKAEKSLKNFSKQGGLASKALGSLKGMLAGGLAVAGVSTALGDIVQKTMEFEKAISSLSSLTGLVGDDLNYLRQQAIILGATTTQTATQVADAFKLIGSQQPQLLESKEALVAVTRSAITLAEASETDVPTAAKALSGALNQMGAGAEYAEEYINILAAASQKGSADIGYLNSAVEKSGGTANAVGIKFNELVAAIETIAPKVTNASEAGTQLKNIFLTLESSADKNLKPSVVGLGGAIDNLAKQHLTAGEMAKMFGKENVNAALALTKSKDTYHDLETAITGTNTAAILSTSCCTGALLPCASCTMRIICASMVSLPVLAATKRNEPVLFTEPAKTLSPCFLNVGRGSPVSMLSSTYDSPAATVPSAAMRSPGRTIIVQPARACSTGMSFSPVSVRTVTVLGCKPISFLMAVDVFCFARASSRRPRSMKAIIMLADSKYTCGSIPCDSQKPGKKRLNTLNR